MNVLLLISLQIYSFNCIHSGQDLICGNNHFSNQSMVLDSAVKPLSDIPLSFTEIIFINKIAYIKSSMEIVNNKAYIWWENGEVKYEYNYEEGVLSGQWKFWDENGRLKEERNYEKGRRNGICKIFKDTALVLKGAYNNGLKTGMWFSWGEQGKLKRETEYFSGKKNGIWKKYKKGYLKTEGTYVHDVKTGIWKDYYTNGQLQWEKNYVDGLLHGWTESFSSDGKSRRKSYWEKGTIIKSER